MSSRSGLPDPRLLRRRLLRWFDAHRRELPWRRTHDPWAILVSEVMLQQTTVTAATPYYVRFMDRWPSPSALAAAGRDELLAQWAGLGYYRRAHMLMDAASAVSESGGAMPGDYAGLLALPGVGRYTAAAVASIAFGERVAAVDGNVERVVTRLAAIEGDPKRAPAAAAIRAAADALLSPSRPGDFNQALMDLGATICRPTAPRCLACPLESLCAAHRAGRPERLPTRPARAPATPVTRLAAVVRRGGRVLLERRAEPPNEGFLELPSVDVVPSRRRADGEPRDGAADLRRGLARRLGVELRVGAALPVHRHSITRYRIRVHPYLGTLCSAARGPGLLWVSPRDVDRPLTTATRRILAASLPRLLRDETR